MTVDFQCTQGRYVCTEGETEWLNEHKNEWILVVWALLPALLNLLISLPPPSGKVWSWCQFLVWTSGLLPTEIPPASFTASVNEHRLTDVQFLIDCGILLMHFLDSRFFNSGKKLCSSWQEKWSVCNKWPQMFCYPRSQSSRFSYLFVNFLLSGFPLMPSFIFMKSF